MMRLSMPNRIGIMISENSSWDMAHPFSLMWITRMVSATQNNDRDNNSGTSMGGLWNSIAMYSRANMIIHSRTIRNSNMFAV